MRVTLDTTAIISTHSVSQVVLQRTARAKLCHQHQRPRRRDGPKELQHIYAEYKTVGRRTTHISDIRVSA